MSTVQAFSVLRLTPKDRLFGIFFGVLRIFRGVALLG